MQTNGKAAGKDAKIARHVCGLNLCLCCFLTMGLVWDRMAAPMTGATKVFLLAGQSNCLGCGGYGDSPVPPPYDKPQTEVHFWSEKPLSQENTDQSENRWVPLKTGYGYGLIQSGIWVGSKYKNCFGPEVSAGYRLKQLHPKDDVYIIKYAVGATNLFKDWNPNGSGRCYPVFKSRVNAALKNLRDANRAPEIAGMMWLQGASDAMAGEYTAKQYAHNLENFVVAVRKDFDAPNMPIVIGRYSTIWGTPENNRLLRTAQESVPKVVGHASWISTDDLPVWPQYPPDVNHFNTKGQIELGIRFADAMYKLGKTNRLSQNR